MPQAHEAPKVTSAAEWKSDAEAGVITTLPSGKVVKARRTMDLMDLLKSGKIPNPLAKVITRLIEGGIGGMPTQDDISEESIKDLLVYVDDTVVKVMVQPKVAVPPKSESSEATDVYEQRCKEWETTLDDDTIPIRLMDIEDRMFIFAFAQGFAADAESFRAIEASGVSRLQDGAALPRAAKRAARRK